MSKDGILNEEAFKYVIDNYDETLRILTQKEHPNIDIQLPEDMIEKLKVLAEHQGNGVSFVVELALRIYLHRFNDLFDEEE